MVAFFIFFNKGVETAERNGTKFFSWCQSDKTKCNTGKDLPTDKEMTHICNMSPTQLKKYINHIFWSSCLVDVCKWGKTNTFLPSSSRILVRNYLPLAVESSLPFILINSKRNSCRANNATSISIAKVEIILEEDNATIF